MVSDEDEQERQIQLAESFNPDSFWRVHSKDLNTIAHAAKAQLLVKKAAAEPDPASPTTNNVQPGMEENKMHISPSPELQLFNSLEGQPEAWQLGEPVDDFINRLPPLTTPIATCPWIWAMNPHRTPYDKYCPRADDFTTRGRQLLVQSSKTRRKIREEGANGPKAMVTKLLSQESKALQERIASLARETHVIAGKWMLFPRAEDVTRVWRKIVTGVIDNRLGCGCKVATDNGKNERLLCVYTKNFENTDDVLRVLNELNSMGLVPAEKPIYYKSDAYTYLDLIHGTASGYGLQASLYNSQSLLADGKISKSVSLPQKK
ncbi:hypothetical protein GMOD_00008717 [Pyrenophora seminiperda CCB06]|uniref:DUF1917-domain-containing protein n=1 Tax=Pyrenophora seminiperda CCB06 TaxID=1302712 RepID=A0A3M7M5L4_9PLEO|nr:hypothetical protein GMOD_00008717 [Pyrenophora seminiperda CCB06]